MAITSPVRSQVWFSGNRPLIFYIKFDGQKVDTLHWSLAFRFKIQVLQSSFICVVATERQREFWIYCAVWVYIQTHLDHLVNLLTYIRWNRDATTIPIFGFQISRENQSYWSPSYMLIHVRYYGTTSNKHNTFPVRWQERPSSESFIDETLAHKQWQILVNIKHVTTKKTVQGT